MELKKVENPVDSAGALKQTLSNLFYGWGYNFYRAENKLRADDFLIRSKVSELLGYVRGALSAAEQNYRRAFLPAPTREHPFPDRAAVAGAKALERAQKVLETYEVKVRTASVPEMDRVHQRHLQERSTLERLTEVDLSLVEACIELKRLVSEALEQTESLAPQSIDGFVQHVLKTLSIIDEVWVRREAVLSVIVA